ncbi:hypothetical protein K501DRAFT_299396 [Backusella circina FSU 941]|nr:hypothetical protein K501DRAFT_299396 [Backusella circina FSU 941]
MFQWNDYQENMIYEESDELQPLLRPVKVLTGLVILSATQPFEYTDKLTGLSTECRLCGSINPITEKEGKDLFHQSLEGFSSSVVWLIFAAFHLGEAVENTQLELFLAPSVPSNTARGGGIILPIIQSISTTLCSTPDSKPQIGAFIALVGNHQSKPAFRYRFKLYDLVQRDIMPVLLCALCLPLFIKWKIGFNEINIVGYKASNRGNIVEYAKRELKDMGPVSIKEWVMTFS